MSKKYLLFALVIVLLALTGCSAAGTQAPAAGEAEPPQSGELRLNRDALPSYQSDFQITFTGSKTWSYALKTRKTSDMRETVLHIEGVDGAQNPGDIRLVTDGTTSWMIGEGTDNECVQYPNGAGMDPTFLHPESLISRAQMEGALTLVGEETVGGVAMLHYTANGVEAGQWQNATMDIWTERDSGMLLRFKLEGTGVDPFFGSGSGKVAATYNAAGMGDEAIAPVAGCELSVPMPDNTQMFVRLPGMASFDSTDAAESIITFYQTALPQEGWTLKEEPAQTEGLTVLSYYRGAEAVEIHVEALSDGSRVKMLFVPMQ